MFSKTWNHLLLIRDRLSGVQLGEQYSKRGQGVPNYVQVKVPPLSHYTDAAGLIGICSNNAFWATCAQYSNDRSEVIYAQSVAHIVCKELFGRRLSAGGEIFKQLIMCLLGEDPVMRTDAYLTSFCAASDLLSQWRAYSRSAGFEIKLKSLTAPSSNLSGAEVLILDSPSTDRKLLAKVIYEKEEQKTRLKIILERALAIIEELTLENEQTPDIVATLCSLETTAWLYTVKHPKFREEEEWRAIIFPKKKPVLIREAVHAGLMGRELPFSYQNPEHLKFRTSRQHSVIPYCELIPVDGNLPIEEVICGPGSHEVLTSKAVRLLLESKGFSNVTVSNSDVPLTPWKTV